MNCQIEIKGLAADGAMLIWPTDPEFDSRVYWLLPEDAVRNTAADGQDYVALGGV